MKAIQKGFTVVELVIVVAVVAILSTIAYSGYTESIRKARRTEARNAMLNISALQERFRYSNPRYADSLVILGSASAFPQTDSCGSAAPIPAGAVRTEKCFYDIRMAATAAPLASAFTLTATPINGQVDDKCGRLTLNNFQLKGSSGPPNASPAQPNNPDCWK